MYNRIRIYLYAMMIVLIALASAFSVIPARADDGAPPPPAAPSTAKTPAVHSQLPAGTGVVVVNSSGHKVSLVSQQAADIITSSDPIWCPTGVAPKPGLGGCTPTQGTFNGGLLPLIVNKPVNGTIWIVSGPETDILPIIMNGAGLGTTVFHTLTLNGGWNGLPAGKLDPLNPSVFVVPLTIAWNAAVTLNDITVFGASSSGLTVTTPGNIVLNSFDAESNAGHGANLNNTSGAGTITVNYSAFDYNLSAGLHVNSNRTISIKHITAINNGFDGVYLDNCNWNGSSACLTPSAQPVNITGVNTFNLNGLAGLWVYSRGAITAGNITATYNSGDDGVYLDNCRFDPGTSLCRIPGAYAVTVKGTNNFSNNGFDGIEVWASGPITANNLNANNNGTNLDTITPSNTAYFGVGAMLNNFGAPTFKPLILTGTNTFNWNGATGLWLESFGVIKANNVTADGNGFSSGCFPSWICDGLNLPYWDSSGFTLTGYGRFNGNSGDGIDGTVWGPVSLTNMTADGNGKWGVNVDNCNFVVNVCDAHGNVTLTGANAFTDNGFTGFTAISSGNVTLNNVTASFNGQAHNSSDGDGVYVDNCSLDGVTHHCDVIIPRSVLVNGVNTFNGNYEAGLNVMSSGAITAKQLTATDNGSTGAKLVNIFGFVPRNITLTGVNTFVNDGFDGLEFFASGAVNLTQVWADYNFLDGVFGSAVGRITITCGSMYSNTARGLEFTGSGITLKGVFSGPNGAADLLFPAPVTSYLCPLP